MSQTKPFYLRMKPEIYEALKKEAEDYGVAMSALVNLIILSHVGIITFWNNPPKEEK